MNGHCHHCFALLPEEDHKVECPAYIAPHLNGNLGKLQKAKEREADKSIHIQDTEIDGWYE